MTDRFPARGPHLAPSVLRAATVVLAAVLAVTLAACGGGGSKSTTAATATPQSQPIQGGKKLAALWPLTGEAVNSPTPNRPVLVTKIDNSSDSRPQIGLSKADLITEELVEGGITRLAVFYYQHLPAVAGPVRSMRASDIGIVLPAHGVLVASGAAPPTLARLNSANITFFQGSGPGYYRDYSRIAPHNLMVRMAPLAATLKRKAIVPASYLPWGTAADFKGGTPAAGLDAVFSRSSTTSWKYAGGRYTNTNSNASPSDQFHPDTVLVLRVREGNAGYLDPAGNTVPETLYYGQGNALIFHGGKLVRATWSKKNRMTPVTLRTAAGPLKIPAGHVWIELVPIAKDGGNVVVHK